MSAPRGRPRATAADLVEIVRSHDLSVKAGKSALWAAIATLGGDASDKLRSLCAQYRAQGMSVGVVNRNAALDFAATMPGAGLLPAGVLDELRVGGDGSVADDDEFDRLRAAVRIRQRNGQCKGGLLEGVSWVASNLRRPLHTIEADEVPNCEALNQLMFARENEAEWRRMYDSRRIPSQGFMGDTERGLVDNGAPMADVISTIFNGVAELRGKRESNNGDQVPELRVVGVASGG